MSQDYTYHSNDESGEHLINIAEICPRQDWDSQNISSYGDDDRGTGSDSSGTTDDYGEDDVHSPRGGGLLSCLNLHGRDTELRELRSAFDRIANTDDPHSEAVVLCGHAGAGKTALVEKGLREYVIHQKHSHLVMARFERDTVENETTAYKYGPILHVFTDLLEILCQNHQSDTAEALQYGLSKDQQHDLAMLLGASFRNFMRWTKQYEDQNLIKMTTTSVRGLLSLFRALLKALSLMELPLVLVFDDVQNAPNESLYLLISLLKQRNQLHHILFVYIYQDNSSGALMELVAMETTWTIPTTDIPVRNLDAEGVRAILEEALWQASSSRSFRTDLPALAELVHRRTQGNPRHVLQFLNHMMVSFFGQGEYTCSVDKIRRETSSTQNALEASKSWLRIRRGLKFWRILTVAALLCQPPSSREFEETSVTMMATDLDRVEWDDIDSALQQARETNVIEKSSNGRFSFTHAGLKQMLLESLDDVEDGKSLRDQIEQLLKNQGQGQGQGLGDSPRKKNASSLGARYNDSQPFNLMRMNLEAAQMALQGQFPSTTETIYFESGDSLLPRISDELWITDMLSTAEKHLQAAEQEFQNGSLDRCGALVDVVLKKCAKDTFKLQRVRERARKLEVLTMTTRGDFKEASRLGLWGLNEDCLYQFPYDPTQGNIRVEQVKVKQELRGLSDLDLLDDSTVSDHDAKFYASLSLLATVFYNAVLDSRSPRLANLAGLRLMRLAINCRASLATTPYAFAAYAFVAYLSGSFKEAERFRKLAHSIMEDHEDGEDDDDGSSSGVVRVRTLMLQASTVALWTNYGGADNYSDQLEQIVTDSVESNDVATFFVASHAKLVVDFCIGEHLDDVLQDCELLSDRMQHLEHFGCFEVMIPMWQLVLNLIGESSGSHPCYLEGAAMDKIKETTADKKNPIVEREVYCYSLVCACFFENWEMAETLLKELHSSSSNSSNQSTFSNKGFGYLLELSCVGICCFEASRRCPEQPDLLSRGRAVVAEVEAYVNNGCGLWEAPLQLLKALEDTLAPSSPGDGLATIYEGFDKCCELAKHFDLSFLECLALQQAAAFASSHNDLFKAHSYAANAVVFCDNWGADELSHFISEKYFHQSPSTAALDAPEAPETPTTMMMVTGFPSAYNAANNNNNNNRSVARRGSRTSRLEHSHHRRRRSAIQLEGSTEKLPTDSETHDMSSKQCSTTIRITKQSHA